VRFPELLIERDDETGNYTVRYRRHLTLSGQIGLDKDSNVQLFLNELPTPSVFLEMIPVDQIAGVKFMRNFVGSAGNGAAIAIYLKKGEDLYKTLESPTDMISYNGYAIKNFIIQITTYRNPKIQNRITGLRFYGTVL
jgi:hypothetical protein